MRWLEEVISFAKSSRPPFRLGAESPRRFQRRAIKKTWGTESSWVAATRQPESGWKFDPHAQWVTGGAEASWQQLHMATLATMAHTLATSLRHRRCNWEALGARWFLADFFTVSTEQEVFFGVTFCIQSLEAFHHLGIRYFSMVILSQGPQDGLIESWIAAWPSVSQNVDPPHAVSDPEKCNYKAMIRHDSRTATVVLWEIAGKKVLTAKSSSSWRAQASLDLAWPWKPCIAHNHSFAATAPKRLDLKTPQSDVCAWFGKSPMDANTAHCASLIKINEKKKPRQTTNYY